MTYSVRNQHSQLARQATHTPRGTSVVPPWRNRAARGTHQRTEMNHVKPNAAGYSCNGMSEMCVRSDGTVADIQREKTTLALGAPSDCHTPGHLRGAAMAQSRRPRHSPANRNRPRQAERRRVQLQPGAVCVCTR